MTNPEIGIQYLIANTDQFDEDFEKTVAAVGAYQDEVPISVRQTAEIGEDDKGYVSVGLIRTMGEGALFSSALHAAEVMKKGVEAHFPEADRDRLARQSIGLVQRGQFITE